MRSMVSIYIYIYIYIMYVTVYIHEQDEYLTYENWTANFDCIHCQNFSLKTKFILDFFFYYYLFILITLGGFTQHTYYMCFKL